MSHSIPMDPDRRRWLTATSVAGGAGVVAASVPFVASMAPSERARALGAPVELDVQDVAMGELRTKARSDERWFRGDRRFCRCRGADEVVERAEGRRRPGSERHDDLLADPRSLRSDQPAYARNIDRSVKPELSVMVGLCTHLGCIPTFRPVPGAADLGANWPGGFFCPCHGSKFDLAGRVFKNVPAPTNLEVPAHHFAGANRLLIGVDPIG